MVTFDNILVLLEASGRSQKELADYLGVNKNRITDWKSGRINSYTKYLPQIADYLGVSIDYLLGREESPLKEKPATESDGQFEEVWKLFNQLNPAEQEQAVKYLEFLHATSSSKKP